MATTAIGDFVHRAPVAFQRIDGEHRGVDAGYRLVDGVVGFDLGTYDPHEPLVIDPATDLEYSTYLGGGDLDIGHAIAIDDGDAYIAGSTLSTDFPTTTGPYPSDSGTNTFVSRISPDGAGPADLVSSAVVGGSANESGLGMALDGGDAYVTGITRSSDFPVTSGAYDESHNGFTDSFLARLTLESTGSADLTYATLLGGQKDAFLTRISPDGAAAADLVYSTYLGGPSFDDAAGIAVADSDAYIVGTAQSARFPTTAGAYDRTFNGDGDGYVARISPDGAGKADLRYSTFLGGRKEDWVNSIVVDGRAFDVVGGSESAGFPTTVGAFDRTYGGGVDGIVSRLTPASRGRRT